MPENGIDFLPKKQLIQYDEMMRLMRILKPMGVDKIRITGGEPFARKGIMPFLQEVKKEIQPRAFSITSNATFIKPYLHGIPKLFDAVNISLDSLDPQRFFEITRRDVFHKIMDNIHALMAEKVVVKVNAVVMGGRNDEDIAPLVEWTRNQGLEVRFIEEMPFNGSREAVRDCPWDHKRILARIRQHFKRIDILPQPPSSTSMMYQVRGFKGKFGIIPAFSRTFCGTCNRIRITPKGELRTCLYSPSGTDLLGPMRANASDEDLKNLIVQSVLNKEKDGFEAAGKRTFIPIYESMTSIGG